ncbi:hypothetical protein CYANOKiyG1_29980 [Okeania sp. KiyG1]|nr:AMP-binding protein [Okeania sp. KiyG1]GGA15954.1 hypothetical protein CYANOKiyG1_29980 [Okeania sp. KiyG1]
MSNHKVSYQCLTPQSFLERSVAAFHQKDAIVYRQQRWTYAEFATRVNQLANALKTGGYKKAIA